MREKERIKRILNKLERLWLHNQDMRFGQLLINLGIADDSLRVWQNEDSGLEKYLDKNIENMSKKG